MLWPLACWDCGFESRREHGCVSVVSDVYCKVDVSATGWSLVQRVPNECGVVVKPWPTRSCRVMRIKSCLVFPFVHCMTCTKK